MVVDLEGDLALVVEFEAGHALEAAPLAEVLVAFVGDLGVGHPHDGDAAVVLGDVDLLGGDAHGHAVLTIAPEAAPEGTDLVLAAHGAVVVDDVAHDGVVGEPLVGAVEVAAAPPLIPEELAGGVEVVGSDGHGASCGGG